MNRTETQNISERNVSKTRDFFVRNAMTLSKISLITFGLLIVYMFVMLMVPASATHSQTNFVQQTAFYSVKYSSNFASYNVMLTPAAFILIFLIVGALIFFALVVHYNKNSFLAYYNSLEKKEKKNFLGKQLVIYISFALCFLIMLIFVLIPPNFAAVRQFYWLQQIESGTDFNNRESIIASLTLLNVTTYDGAAISTITSLGILGSLLKDTVASYSSNFAFTPFTNFGGGTVSYSSGIYAVIVLFSVLFSLGVISWFVTNCILRNINLNLSVNKEVIKQIKTKIHEKREYNKQMNKTKKELLARENELLKSLNEVDLAKVDEEKKLGVITQEELERKLSKNNEIKKQLDDLIKEKAEIQKQKIANSKIRSALNKIQNQDKNKTTRKDKKQTITIPDKELDEIFKNLEID